MWINQQIPDHQFSRTAEHKLDHASALIGKSRTSSLLPAEYDRLALARLNTPQANTIAPPIRGYPTGHYREPTELTSRLREVRGALEK